MAFTSTDLTSIETAIMEIVQGKRVVSIDVGGKTREFQRVDLVKMMELRDMIKADVAAAAGTGGIFSKVSFKDGI